MITGETSPADIFKEPYPCHGCGYWTFCKEKQRSCKSFHIYVTERGRLDLTQRSPDREMYHKTFVRRGKPELAWERITLLEGTHI